MLGLSCKEKGQDIRIVFYQNGQGTTINPKRSGSEDLVTSMENLLINADDIIRLAVDPELVNKIKKEERVIEIIYPNPIELTINRNRDTIHPDRLLIPLSGEFAGDLENPQAVIFHGYPAYSSGPYANRKGVAEIIGILKNMGIK